MKKRLKIDLALFSIIYLPSCIVCFYSSIFPYLGSFMKHFNNNIKLTSLFQYFPIIYLGFPMGNFMFEKFLFFFGFKKSLYILSVLFFLYTIFLFNISSMLCYIISLLLQGFFYQIFTTAISFYFCYKYKNGSDLVSYTYGFKNFLNFVFPCLALKIINPNNFRINDDNSNDIYFNWNVSKNITYFLLFFGISSLISSIICIWFLDDLKIKENWKYYFLFFFDKKKIEKLNNYFQNQLKNKKEIHAYEESLLSDNISSSIHIFEKNNSENLSNQNEEPEENNIDLIKYNKIKKSGLFIGFFLITSVKYSSLFYFAENFKYITMIYYKNDEIITIFISLSCLIAVFTGFISPSIYRKLGFYIYNAFCIFLNILISGIIFFFGKEYPIVLLFSLLLVRFDLNLNYVLTVFCLYGIFGAKLGLKLSKFFDYSFFFGMSFGIFCSNFFNISKDFNLFKLFFGVEFVILLVFLYYFKNFEKNLKAF